MLQRIGSYRNCRRAGFTMVELLVVIAVLALLISLVTAVASKGIHQQRVRNTQQIMQSVTLALEQFAVGNPLRAIYDRKDNATFGKFPPYQLAHAGTNGSVSELVESDHPLTLGLNDPPDTIQERLAWDMSGRTDIALNDWVVIETPPPGIGDPDSHNDNRALYAYLKVFSPASLKLIPETSLKPLYPQTPPDDRSYVNSGGAGAVRGNPGAEDILGIHDAWGVPLDYMLYVKCEWGPARNRVTGQMQWQFRVVERKPILRSRGIKRDVYDEWVRTNIDPTQRDAIFSPPEKWIFSEDLPKPWAGLTDFNTGILDNSLNPPSRANGWVRAVGADEDYAYRPDGDTSTP